MKTLSILTRPNFKVGCEGVSANIHPRTVGKDDRPFLTHIQPITSISLFQDNQQILRPLVIFTGFPVDI
jgi:hypothetical protein